MLSILIVVEEEIDFIDQSVMIQTMVQVNINRKINLPRCVEKVQKGETVVLYKGKEPVAQIIPFPKKKPAWAYFGIAKDKILGISDDFNEPLKDEDFPGVGL